MAIQAKTLATRLARECRAMLKTYASYKSVSEVKDVGLGAYQFQIWGMSKRPREHFASGDVRARAYVTVYANHDVNIEYNKWFPEELFDVLMSRVTPTLTKSLEE